MGASVMAYWVGITEGQMESQPGFWNDCKAWGDWMAERMEHQDVLHAMERLGVSALLTFTTAGVADSEIEWVTPSELERAAIRLRELVLVGDPDTGRIVETYAKSANDVDPVGEEFVQDLVDIAEIARFAQREGVSHMTLEVNW
jgi:hypothetical protein